jgi:hypothetical protein
MDRRPKVIQETEVNKWIGSKRVIVMISTGMWTYHANSITHERKNSRNKDNDLLLYRIRNSACVHLLCDGIGE